MSTQHLKRAARSQIGAEILLKLYGRITGESLGEIRYPSQLSGNIITREQIENTEYESLSDIILELRNIYSASGMRCLRSDAASRKSPVLNLIRQVARANGLGLISDRKPSGYMPDGRKQFIYWYKFESLDGDYEIPPEALPPRITVPAPMDNTRKDTSTSNIRSTNILPTNCSDTRAPSPEETNIISGTIILPPGN